MLTLSLALDLTLARTTTAARPSGCCRAGCRQVSGEEMLTPAETHEQEMAAAQEDADQFLRRIVEQYGDKPVQAKKRGEQ
jgi:hypothetical protein